MDKLDGPRDTDTHTLADFIELLCLLTVDRSASPASVKDFIIDSSDRDQVEDESAADDWPDGQDDGNSRDRALPARIDERLVDAFAHLVWRGHAFGDAYPFSLKAGGNVLSAPQDLTDGQELYVALLACANLPFFKRTERGELTTLFEKLSLAAMRRLWPARGVVQPFGKNETTYIGAKWQRMNQLGTDIGGKPNYHANSFRRGDSGDGGIDLVAWLSLDDHERWNVPSALAQCACSRSEWPSKQSEISHGRLGQHIVPTHAWTQMIFIPQCFRDNLGRWAFEGELADCVVVDRLRMLANLETTDLPDQIRPEALVKFLSERLDLV